MNRAMQVQEALSSCLLGKLPAETEFVVIDNASTDSTEHAVLDVLGDCGYHYYYEKVTENLGVGGGRNYAYEKASGEFVYMLDDDATIDFENNPQFFMQAIELFETNHNVITLTTQIYDTAWKRNRMENYGIRYSEKLYKCQMFCGGSHFLRKSFFVDSPYPPNKYGYEEIPPFLRVIDAKKVNAFCPDLLVIHNPKRDKWDWSDEKNHDLLVKEVSLSYAIKRMMYPVVFLPLLRFAYRKRCKKHLKNVSNGKRRADEIVCETILHYSINNNKKIRIRTVLGMCRDFGITVF